jgi:hypothetical protein
MMSWFHSKDDLAFKEREKAAPAYSHQDLINFIQINRNEDRRWAVEQAVIGGTPTEQIAARAEAILDYLHPMPETDHG